MQLRATLIAICWIAWVLIWIVTAVIFRPDSRDVSPRADSRSRRYWLRLLLAAIGSALVIGPGWLVVVIGAGACFVVSLRVDENDMAGAFPDQYPEYAGHTKRLIPFVYRRPARLKEER